MQFYGFSPQLIDQNIENIENFHEKSTERYSIWLEKLVFFTKSSSFDIKQEIP